MGRFMAPYQFRSTGSYEPDPVLDVSPDFKLRFDPQALTSLTAFLKLCKAHRIRFDPQALTSLTPFEARELRNTYCFDPQALTSLT